MSDSVVSPSSPSFFDFLIFGKEGFLGFPPPVFRGERGETLRVSQGFPRVSFLGILGRKRPRKPRKCRNFHPLHPRGGDFFPAEAMETPPRKPPSGSTQEGLERPAENRLAGEEGEKPW